MDNWVIYVLPFTEHNEIYKQINHTLPMSNTVNATARKTVIPEMLCPSDAGHNRQPFMGTQGQQTRRDGRQLGAGNYAANACLDFLEPGSGAGQGSPSWQNPHTRGIMGCNCAATTQKITDGLSHTVLLGEIRCGLTAFDRAVFGPCPALPGSGIWATSYFLGGDDYGPDCLEPYADDCQNCEQIATQLGGGGSQTQRWGPGPYLTRYAVFRR